MADTGSNVNLMEKLVSLCKRRGFIYPASEIYGGLNGFWDYGPLGVLLKNNIRDWWWRNMVECPPLGPDGHPLDMVGVDTAIIQNRSEEHTSELQSRLHLVCRLLLEKKKKNKMNITL